MRLLTILTFALTMPSAALAQSLTLTVDKVEDGRGVVRAQLCKDMQQLMASGCTHTAFVTAKAGKVELTFKDTPAGSYLLQTYHDSNNNGRLDIPAEGYGFGNNQPYPPDPQKALVTVGENAKTSVALTYMFTTQADAAPEVGLPAPAGVIKTDVRANGLYGALYSPVGAKNLPTIIAIGGSEGGLDTISAISQSYAQHGYAVLALAYWRAPGLPQSLEGVPLEYFGKAIDWLSARPEVDAARIGMMGWSRGGEGVLLYGSRDKRVKAVMALAGGSHVIVGISQNYSAPPKPAWTEKGSPIPFFMPDMSIFIPGQFRKTMDQAHRDVTKHPEAEIPVEAINGPVLLLSGSDDGVWNSPLQAERVIARLKAHAFKFEARHIDYTGAGHLVFTGDPANPAGAKRHEPIATVMGGTPEANKAAWASSWPTALAFFDGALKSPRQ